MIIRRPDRRAAANRDSTPTHTRAPAPGPGPRGAEHILGEDPIIEEQALWLQFQRIGGNLTPQDVSRIILEADGGQIARFVDLANEARQKDGHMHSVLQTRELAVKGLEWSLSPPRGATSKEKKATELLQGLLQDSENFPDLIHHLTGAGVLHGHATAETMYRHDSLGGKPFLVPYKWNRVHPNRFAFAQSNGRLLFTEDGVNGVDLLETFPGKFVQYQPIVNGDTHVREGLARVLVWLALFRNWSLRDWLQLGEIGWKPWRIGTYEKGAHDNDIAILKRALRFLGTTGAAALPNTVKLDVAWPKGTGSTVTSSHRELFDVMGAEMSKATLGQTLSVEQGNRGSQSLGKVQERVRDDILVADAVGEASIITRHVIRPFFALNYGERIRPCRFIFHTEDTVDLKAFAEAIKILRAAGLKDIPAAWVRNQGGIPARSGDEEVLGDEGDEPPPPGGKPTEDESDDPEEDDSEQKKVA